MQSGPWRLCQNHFLVQQELEWIKEHTLAADKTGAVRRTPGTSRRLTNQKLGIRGQGRTRIGVNSEQVEKRS